MNNFFLLILLSIFILNNSFADEKLKIGISVPLTGPLASMGDSFVKGIELFKQDYPVKYDKLKLFIQDHKYEGKEAVNSFHFLNNTKKVDYMIFWGNTPSSVIGPLSKKYKVKTIALSSSPISKDNEYLISFAPITKYIKSLSNHIDNIKSKKPAAITINLGNAEEAVYLLEKELSEKLKIELVSNEETNFLPILSRLKKYGADSITLFVMPKIAEIFAKQASQLKINMPIIGGDIFALKSFKENFKKYLPNLYISYGYVKDGFLEKYKKLDSETPYFFETASAYSMMLVMSEISLIKGD